jgi:phosphoglycerate kinase
VLGGAKVKDKIPVILKMLDMVDEMIIGGGMSYTFNKEYEKINIGSSLYDEEGSRMVHDIMKKARSKGLKIHIPIDFYVADRFAEDANTKLRTIATGIEDGWEGVDIGPKTIEDF